MGVDYCLRIYRVNSPGATQKTAGYAQTQQRATIPHQDSAPQTPQKVPETLKDAIEYAQMQRRATNPPPAPVPPRAPASPEKEQPDWCGSDGTEWVWDSIGNKNMTDACRQHDNCYGSQNADRYQCDRDFYWNLRNDLGNDPLGAIINTIYFNMVRMFGDEAFKKGQNTP